MAGFTSFLKVLLYVLIVVNLIIIIINLVQSLNEIKETKVILGAKVGEKKDDRLPDNYQPIRFSGPIYGKTGDADVETYFDETKLDDQSSSLSDDKVMAKFLVKVHKMGHEERFVRIKVYHSVFLAFYVVISVLGIYGTFNDSSAITYAFGIITLLSWSTRLLLYVLSNGIQYGPFVVNERWLSSNPLFEVWSLTLYFITAVISILLAMCMRRESRMKH